MIGLASTVDARSTNGVYFSKLKRGRLNRQGRDAQLAFNLWERSARIVGVDSGWPSAGA
jgi:hypothetical protein